MANGEVRGEICDGTVLSLVGELVPLADLDGVELSWPIGRELDGSLEEDGGRGSARAPRKA